jgi:hypothetical protein
MPIAVAQTLKNRATPLISTCEFAHLRTPAGDAILSKTLLWLPHPEQLIARRQACWTIWNYVTPSALRPAKHG